MLKTPFLVCKVILSLLFEKYSRLGKDQNIQKSHASHVLCKDLSRFPAIYICFSPSSYLLSPVSWILKALFVSFAFISALIFKISFLLLTLRFFISSFSSCFRCRVRLFIWLFSCFLRYACLAMTFPLKTAFIVSHRFWVVVFSFSFVSLQSLISFLISSVIFWLFSSVFFSLRILEFLIVFSPVIEI